MTDESHDHSAVIVPSALRVTAIVRRATDVVAAAGGLIIMAIPMWIIARRIRRDSRGEAIFTQTRAGKDGRPFKIYKFRTMRTDSDPYGNSPHSGDDPRLTDYGRRLRESSLDELPQLWNVLRGDMSLVGPRPLYVSQMEEFTPRQMIRLKVKPGLTGLAQINGRAALTLEEKLEMDVQYVLHRSLWVDFKIVWRTLLDTVKPGRTGIYEVQYSRSQNVRGRNIDQANNAAQIKDDSPDFDK